jgi:hypothetical protein
MVADISWEVPICVDHIMFLCLWITPTDGSNRLATMKARHSERLEEQPKEDDCNCDEQGGEARLPYSNPAFGRTRSVY